MKVKVIHDSVRVYEFLRNKSPYNYIYQLNNLSSTQWENVVCYGLFQEKELMEIAMVNMNHDIPVLLAASFDDEGYNLELLKELKTFLPRKFYTHIRRTVLDEVFSQDSISDLEEYMNMGLTDYSLLDNKHSPDAVRLGFDGIKDIRELLSESYPGAWLDEDLVKLNENFGIYADGRLVSFAGIHAYSEEYGAAAVAHVTTHPDYRKRGYAEAVVAALTCSLCSKIRFVGLNVKIDNLNAVNCYKKLGFREFGSFVACEIEIGGNIL